MTGPAGILGLAFDNINSVEPTPQRTFFSNAASSLSSPIFAAALPETDDGVYNFGFLDDSRYSGVISYTAVDSSNGKWEFKSESYAVGYITYRLPGQTGIIDTGSNQILMREPAVKQYYDSVRGSRDASLGLYTYPCSATLPDLSFQFGTSRHNAIIPGSRLNAGQVTTGGTDCVGLLQSVGWGTQNIYGTLLFHEYYVVFDTSEPRLGIARLD